MMMNDRLRKERREYVFDLALWEATKTGIIGATVVGVATALATIKSKRSVFHVSCVHHVLVFSFKT